MRKILILVLAATALAVGATAWASGGDSAKKNVQAMAMTPATAPELAPLVADARFATAKFATSLRRAEAGRLPDDRHAAHPGHGLAPHEPEHLRVRRDEAADPRLRQARPSLAARRLQWVFTQRPVPDPLPGAQYGSFPAACHYVDGTFVPEPNQANCPRRSPISGARFAFWHPDFVTLHLWLWYPNPDGIYAGMNPLIRPFN